MALNEFEEAQTKSYHNTPRSIRPLLDYTSTYPNIVLWYSDIEMVLHIYSDALYLSEPESNIQSEKHYFLSDCLTNPNKAPTPKPINNGSIHSH